MVEVIKVVNTLPLKYKIGKLVVGGVAGLVAKHYAEKVYLTVYECVANQKIIEK